MSHTPGPWKIIDIPNADGMGIVPVKRPEGVKPRDLEDIASVSKSAEHYDAKANARLISAAPDLLAALKAITPAMPPVDGPCHVNICSQDACSNCCRVSMAHSAIAKAEGRP